MLLIVLGCKSQDPRIEQQFLPAWCFLVFILPAIRKPATKCVGPMCDPSEAGVFRTHGSSSVSLVALC